MDFNNTKKKFIRNIVVYTNSDFPNGGAAENFVRQMVIGLHENGANIKVVRMRGTSYGGLNSTNIKCSNLFFRRRTANDFFKILEFFLIILATPFSLIFNKLKSQIDTAILYGIEYSYYCIPLFITAKLFKIKIFRIITDYYDTESIVPVWWKQPKLFFYEMQFQRVDRLFDGIIVLSYYLKNIAIRNGVNDANILLIPHFIDINSFKSKCNYEVQWTSKTIIGFCGMPSVFNGILDLITAFGMVNEKYDNVILLIIGDPIESVKMQIEEKANASKNHNIFYTGFLQKQDVKIQLNRCSVLVNPRKAGRFSEAGFPTKLGEYFATAKPVVSTTTGDIKNYFTNKKELVLVEPDKPESIADGIKFLIENNSIAKKIGKNGYYWATENLDYKKNSSKLLQFIEKT
jgi:glycosyltransferase involved in cell wall biosynthesis